MDDADLRSIENSDEDTQSTIFTQLSNQTTDDMKSVLKHKDSQGDMDFVSDQLPRKIAVAKIPKDHNCIFGALAQLWMNKISSAGQNEATKKLRADVVEHILEPENFAMFLNPLKDHVYALKNPAEIANLTAEQLITECKLFVRHRLSKNKVWGGGETLLAVSNIFSANVIVFNEDGLCQKVKAAGKNYNRSIALRIGSVQMRFETIMIVCVTSIPMTCLLLFYIFRDRELEAFFIQHRQNINSALDVYIFAWNDNKETARRVDTNCLFIPSLDFSECIYSIAVSKTNAELFRLWT